MVRIAKCECVHEYQDKRYGKGMRVHNTCGRDGKSARCTVCGKNR